MGVDAVIYRLGRPSASRRSGTEPRFSGLGSSAPAWPCHAGSAAWPQWTGRGSAAAVSPDGRHSPTPRPLSRPRGRAPRPAAPGSDLACLLQQGPALGLSSPHLWGPPPRPLRGRGAGRLGPAAPGLGLARYNLFAPILLEQRLVRMATGCVWGCSCHEFMQFVSRIQTPRLSEQEKVSCRRASFHVLRDSAGSARRRLGRAPNCVCAQIAKLTFRARSLGGGAAWVCLGRCCILAAVLPREGVARIFVTHARTDRTPAK